MELVPSGQYETCAEVVTIRMVESLVELVPFGIDDTKPLIVSMCGDGNVYIVGNIT